MSQKKPLGMSGFFVPADLFWGQKLLNTAAPMQKSGKQHRFNRDAYRISQDDSLLSYCFTTASNHSGA